MKKPDSWYVNRSHWPSEMANAVVAELSTVIEAGTAIDASIEQKAFDAGDVTSYNAVLRALRAIAQDQGRSDFVRKLPADAALPTSDVGPIWHEKYAAIMTWQTIGSYTGYASVGVGEISYVWATTARPGNIKANAGGITKTISPGLYAVGCLILGLDYASSTQTIYVPDLRGEFLRGWSDGSGVDAGRVIGSTQAGTEFPSLYVYSASSSSGLLVSHPISSNRGYPNDNIAKNTDSRISGTSSNYMSVPLSPAGVSSLVHFTARPRNVSMLAQIHL